MVDKAEGHGVCMYVNGDKYEGEWKQDLRWGWGKQTYTDGDLYEGEWKNNAMDGSARGICRQKVLDALAKKRQRTSIV